MLQIYLYGPVEQGFLDIEPGTVLDMEGLTPIFDEDLSTGEFSLPLEITWTDRNRRLFGFGERLENFNRSTKTFRCDVFDDMFPELINAQLTILERSGNYSYTRGKFSTTISGTQGLFGSMIRDKKMTELHLGGEITWSGMDSRHFATDVMKGNQPQYSYISFAPLAILDFIDSGRTDFTSEFLIRDTVNDLVVTGSGANNWEFGRRLPLLTGVVATPGTAGYCNYWTVPFFKLRFVLLKIFEEHGFLASGEFLESVDFEDLVVDNNFGIEDYAISIQTDFNRKIVPSNHMPDMLISDFLKGIFDLFSIYPVFINSNEVKLKYRKGDFRDKQILNINKICSDQFTSTYENVEQEKRGYQLQYNWDGDGLQGERVKDNSGKILVATVATAAALGTLSVGFTLTTDHIAYVEADNLFYVLADATTTPMKWDVYGEKLQDYIVGDGERTIPCGISTLCTHAVLNATTGLTEKKNYLAKKQRGSYKNYAGALVKSSFGLRIFYIKKRTFGTNVYPVSFYHNRDSSNSIILPYSLSWHGDYGLAKNFHLEWQNLRERGELVKTEIAVDKKVLTDLNKHNMVERDNVIYLPHKIERSIPLKQTAILQVMPL
jgi:hypothetical protein